MNHRKFPRSSETLQSHQGVGDTTVEGNLVHWKDFHKLCADIVRARAFPVVEAAVRWFRKFVLDAALETLESVFEC